MPLPAGCPPNAPPSTTVQLQACLTTLEFDTVEAAGDEQVLTVIEKRKGSPCPGRTDSTPSCRYGPLASIEPEVHSHQHRLSDLREGRIIARLSLAAGQEGYDKLSVVSGHITYWWVQITEMTEEDLDRKYLQNLESHRKYGRKSPYGRSVFISTAPGEGGGGLAKKEYPLDYQPHHGRFKQALARWVWDPEDEKTQGSCGQGCCS